MNKIHGKFAALLTAPLSIIFNESLDYRCNAKLLTIASFIPNVGKFGVLLRYYVEWTVDHENS